MEKNMIVTEEAKNILNELFEKHQETGECGVYKIEDGKLGEKVSDL